MATSAARKDYAGGAVATTIVGNITASSTSITISDATGWPAGTNGNFWVAISRGESDEEKILCSSRSGTSLTVAGSGRGGDGTSAAAHTSGAAIEHVGAAEDFDEANELTSLADAKGDVIAATAADAWERLAVGSNDQSLVADSAQATGVKWADVFLKLGGGTLSGEVIFADQLATRPKLKDWSEEQTTPSSSSGTLTLDLENGNVFEVTLTENVTTLTISNPPASGDAGAFTLILKQDGTGGRTFAWPAAVKWAGGTAPTVSSGASEVDIFTLITTDAGTTWYGMTAGQVFS